MNTKITILIAIVLGVGLISFGTYRWNEGRTSIQGVIILVVPGFDGKAEFAQVDDPYSETAEGPANLYQMVDGKIQVERGCMPVRDWKFITIYEGSVDANGVPDFEESNLKVVKKSKRDDEPQYIVLERP